MSKAMMVHLVMVPAILVSIVPACGVDVPMWIRLAVMPIQLSYLAWLCGYTVAVESRPSAPQVDPTTQNE